MSESIFIVAQKSVHTLNTANAIVSTFTEKTKEKDEQIIKQQTIRNCESQTENRIQRVRKYFENERTNKQKERRNKPFEIEIPLIASHICVAIATWRTFCVNRISIWVSAVMYTFPKLVGTDSASLMDV